MSVEDLSSQRLFRVRLASREGRGRFRLLLRLQSPQRYRLDATHPLFGRRLWSFDVDGDQALLVDYLQERTCRYTGEVEVAALPLGPFPFASLPAILLGYLPLPPVGPVGEAAEGELRYRDHRGRRWTLLLDDGVVSTWTLWQESRARVEWRAENPWVVMRADDEELLLRWRETVRESSSGPVDGLTAPEGYEDGDCDLGWISGVEGTYEEEPQRSD